MTEEREVCACLAESLIDLDENQDWQEGFNIACKILAHTIRARGRDTSVEKAVLSFKRLTRSIAAARTIKQLQRSPSSVV